MKKKKKSRGGEEEKGRKRKRERCGVEENEGLESPVEESKILQWSSPGWERKTSDLVVT